MIFQGDEAGLVRAQMLDNPLCRSGYEYARRQEKLWRGQSAEMLQSVAEACLELYHRDENLNSLGIAMYLQQLAESRMITNNKKHRG